MTLNIRLLLWALAAAGITLTLLFGPFVAAFVFAGAGLAFVLVLMAIRVVRALDDWRLNHPRLLRRTHAHTK